MRGMRSMSKKNRLDEREKTEHDKMHEILDRLDGGEGRNTAWPSFCQSVRPDLLSQPIIY